MSVTINGTTGITYNDTSVQGTAGLGYGQTWQNLTASRSGGVTYTNSTGRPIEVSAGTTFAANARIGATVGGVRVGGIGVATSGGDVSNTFTVPVGATYVVNFINAGMEFWSELR